MYNKVQSFLLSSLLIGFGLLYIALLGNAGLLERNIMENRLKSLRMEVEKLDNENQNLEAKKRLLKDDSLAMEREARKYFILSENAKIIKFKENVKEESNERLFASELPTNQFKKRQGTENLPPLGVLKAFYFIAASAIIIGVFIKLNR